MPEDDTRTGAVRSTHGGINSRSINTGVSVRGSADSETIRAATEALAKLRSGDVVAAATIQAEEINVGFSYDSTDSHQAIDQLRALRQTLEVAAAESGSEPASAAARIADDAVRELEAAAGTTAVPVRDRIKTILGLLAQASQGVVVTSAGAVALAGGLEAALDVYRIFETTF